MTTNSNKSIIGVRVSDFTSNRYPWRAMQWSFD
jgi:hypothetical protein